MLEVRFHGRGGQGVVLASEILANAAFLEGKDVQSFPFFGVERRGAPLMAFTRISEQPIKVRSAVETPDHVLVLDASLLKAIDVTSGLKEGGCLLVNGSAGIPRKEDGDYSIMVFDATSVSLENGLGSRTSPVVNTSLLGAYAAATGVVKIDSLEASIPEFVPSKSFANVRACRSAYERMLGEVALVEG